MSTSSPGTTGTTPRSSMHTQSRGQVKGEETLQSCDDLMTCARNYAKVHPETAALWCFGVGFLLGWKLKPW